VRRTVDYRDGRLFIIDQTRLPNELIEIELTSYRDVADAIKTMKVRGAPAIGVTAALGIILAASQIESDNFDDLINQLNAAAAEIRATRPTAVNLFKGVDRVIDAASSMSHKPVAEIKSSLDQLGLYLIAEDESVCRRLGAAGADLIKDGSSVLTHCNAGALACVAYGTALGVIRAAVESGKKVRVFADETRPRLQGMKLTAWELMQDGIDVTVITDNMAASLMRRKMIDAVIVGADRITANGDTANKIGTYSLAVLARAHNIPFYVAAPTSTIDLSLPSGDLIPIEERSPDEITCVDGMRIAPKGVKVINPAFDVTPAEFITAIITENGVAGAPYSESLKSHCCGGC
jgi:methylthioribose-1-phosphate isomerase